MKLFFLLLLIFCFLCTTSYADNQTPKNTILHITVSFTIGALIHQYIDKNTNCTEDETRALTFFSTLGLGTLKESIDNEFCWEDIMADAIGAGLAASIEF